MSEHLECGGRRFEVIELAPAEGDVLAVFELYELSGADAGLIPIGNIDYHPTGSLEARLVDTRSVPVAVLEWWIGLPLARRRRADELAEGAPDE